MIRVAAAFGVVNVAFNEAPVFASEEVKNVTEVHYHSFTVAWGIFIPGLAMVGVLVLLAVGLHLYGRGWGFTVMGT